MSRPEPMVTLWPSFPHFNRFAKDNRLSGIRLNSAMINCADLERELPLVTESNATVPLYFDIKGRQLRVEEVYPNKDRLDLVLNHPINVETPTEVIFKAGTDAALLERVEHGRRLVFRGGPKYMVKAGESLHIRHPSLEVAGPQFSDQELAKIAKVKAFGFNRYFLSYVQGQRDVDEFRELVGRDCEVQLKIEDKKGLDYVQSQFKKEAGIKLVAARGDLFIEIDKPHQINEALELIIAKDPEACVGSRILLSICAIPDHEIRLVIKLIKMGKVDQENADKILDSLKVPQVPSCADFCELGYLHQIGYRNMLLCDELCLDEKMLATAINAFESFRQSKTN